MFEICLEMQNHLRYDQFIYNRYVEMLRVCMARVQERMSGKCV